MKALHVTTDVPFGREDVYDFLDVMANHEPFTNHMLREWEYSGPDRGVGSKARVRISAAGRRDTVDIEVIAAEAPAKIVERNVSAGGRRIATGTYTLRSIPGDWTRIRFDYEWQQAPLSERLASPLLRAILRRANVRAMRRLAGQLAAHQRIEADVVS